MVDKISIVVGSWGSYNARNERALGSRWFDLSDYDDWGQIEEELTKQGFELDGLDKDLFVQDIEGIYPRAADWDCMNPKELFELLREANVLKKEYNREIMQAYLEVATFSEFKARAKLRGARWADDLGLYRNFDWYDLGYYFIHEVDNYDIPHWLDSYIDYEKYGREFSYEDFCQYSNGIIQIL